MENKKEPATPKTSEDIAAQENCTVRAVQKWAAKNNVRKIGKGNRAQYLFFDEDIARFRARDKKRGRRWPTEES